MLKTVPLFTSVDDLRVIVEEAGRHPKAVRPNVREYPNLFITLIAHHAIQVVAMLLPGIDHALQPALAADVR